MRALQFTNNILDQYVRNAFGLDESKVTLNNVIDSSGTVPAANQNKIVLSLINIERETMKPFYVRNQKMSDGNFADIHPEQRFNVDLLVTSNFDDYKDTLNYLNTVIQFFQANVRMDAHSFANIPEGISKLEFDIEKLNYSQMHSLWTAMGAKYQPSVIYKMRLLTIQANESGGFVQSVQQTEQVAHS